MSRRAMASSGEPAAKAAKKSATPNKVRGPATKAHVGVNIDCRRVKLADISTAADSGWRPLNAARLVSRSRDRTAIDDRPSRDRNRAI